MILVRLYPFVYMDSIGGKQLLYNALYPSFLLLSVDRHDVVADKGMFSMEENKENFQIAESIKKGDFGLVEVRENGTFSKFSDYTSEFTAFMQNYYNVPVNDKAINAIQRVFVSLTKSIDPLTWSNTNLGGSLMPEVALQFVENMCKLPNLKGIEVFVDRHSYDSFFVIYEKLSPFCKISIYVFYADYQLMYNLFDKIKGCEIHILLFQKDGLCQKELNDLILDKKVTFIHVDVKDAVESELFQKAFPCNNSKFRISCYKMSDIKEAKELLGYNSSDILEQNLSLDDIIRNEWINFNFWGDLYVDADGEVLLNNKENLGKIGDWDKIHFEKLLLENSLWRKVRRVGANCRLCLFRNICPPLTLVEIINNVKFCNIKV